MTLSNGEHDLRAAVVLANGLSVALRHLLGIERKVTSHCHSISLGFDLVPVGRAAFDFPAMTYFSERAKRPDPLHHAVSDRHGMRANLFVYREADDPWLREMRRAPRQTLDAALPRLKRITGEFDIAGDVKIRPADLYVSSGHRQAGIVLVGDAFATTCPVTGTGSDKVFTDVERLCRVHIPSVARDRGHGRAEDRARSTTIPSSKPATPGRAPRPGTSNRCRSTAGFIGARSAGRGSCVSARRGLEGGELSRPAILGAGAPNRMRSLLVVLVVIVVFIVIVGLTGVMRGVALVVPEFSVDAARGQQLRHASRARSPCRLK